MSFENTGKTIRSQSQIEELPDDSIQPLEEEKITATQKWEQLDEVTRQKVQEYHEQHREQELEVQTLEAGLGMVTKFFDRRLKEARQKLTETKNKLGHTRYREAAGIYERMQAEQGHPEEKAVTVKNMMDRRDQLKKELEAASSSWVSRYLGEGRTKAKELQEIENRLKHPMYRIRAVEKKEPKAEAPRYTAYDYKQNYLRLVREKSQTEDQAEQKKIEDQITALRKEMAIQGMEDPEIAFAPRQEVKTYEIPEAEMMGIEETEEMKEEREKLQKWLEIAGIDPSLVYEYIDRDVDAFKNFLSGKIDKTYNHGVRRALENALPHWENYLDLLMGKKPRNSVTTEIDAKKWEARITKEETTVKFKTKIMEIVTELRKMPISLELATLFDQTEYCIKAEDDVKKIIPESYNIREEILKMSTQLSPDEFAKAAALYNEFRNQLKQWTEVHAKVFEEKPDEKKLEIVSSREIRAEQGQIYEVQHSGSPRQKITEAERSVRKEGLKKTEVTEEEGITLYMNGDDVYAFDPDLGMGIIADGTTAASSVPKGQESPSRQMARIGTLGLAKLFEQTEELSSPEEKKALIEGKLDELTSLMIEGEKSGGTMLLGTLYLPETNQLLVVDIGNCQLAVQKGNEFVSLKNKPTKKDKEEPIKISKNKMKDRAQIVDTRTGAERTPYVYLINLDEYTDEQGELRLLLGSDGYEESTGEDLATAGTKLIKEGISGAIKRTHPKDDISVLDLHIPAKPMEQPMTQTA